jgi:hypothetical protein
MKRIILLLIPIVLLAVGWYAYKTYTGKVPSLNEVKSEEKIDAISLIAAFEKDSASANQKYLGKIIEVSGTIKTVDKENAAIALGNAEATLLFVALWIVLLLKESSSLNQGATITIKGACTGFLPDDTGLGLGSDVVLNRCVIENK